jgi:hypothetical protein
MAQRSLALEPREPEAGPWRVVPMTALIEQLYAAAGPRAAGPASWP